MIYSNKITLPSGEVVEAEGGFIGISIHGKDESNMCFYLSSGRDYEFEVYESAEDFKSARGHEYADGGGDVEVICTAEDRKFLAELMIARWQEFGGIKKA